MVEERELVNAQPNHIEVVNGAPSAGRPHEEIENYVEAPLTPHVLGYLQSENGHQLANRLVEFLESLKKATLDEQAKAKTEANELAKMGLKHTMLIQTIGLFAVVGSIVGLSAAGALGGEAATILGAMAGYLFAQQKKVGA